MKSLFKIQDVELCVDIEATRKFYLTQSTILEDCGCENCVFFIEKIIKMPFEVWKVLQDLGVDIHKNLTKDPAKMWTVLNDDNTTLLHCDQLFQVIGELKAGDRYYKIEHGFKVDVSLQQDNDGVAIALTIDHC